MKYKYMIDRRRNMPAATVISDRPPFYRENAPVGALKPEMTPPLEQRSFERWGVAKERSEAWWGGGRGVGRENACVA